MPVESFQVQSADRRADHVTVDIGKTGKETRNKSVEKLTKLVRKCIEGLDHFEHLPLFRKSFSQDEHYFITRLKCRLNADLQHRKSIECSLYEG